MAGRKVFSFGLDGIGAMTDALDNYVEEVERKLDETLLKLALKVQHDARRLEPIDSGDLEAATIVGEIQKMVGLTYIDIGVSAEVDHYAVAQHEGFMKTKNGKLVTFTPGEKTLSKGAYNGEMPGKKFLERALKMNEKLIIEELSKVLGV
jgi:HK97 gp10 family phage protein